MTIAEILLEDFDAEMAGTRTTLERIPASDPGFRCHDRSMPMGRLAMHVATLPHFGTNILTTDVCDLQTASFPPLDFVTSEAMLAVFDAAAAELRAVLSGLSDEDLMKPWRLVVGDIPIAEGKRSLLYRTMFLNHLVHHRAQLGIYLRLHDLPVPSLYGPSADDPAGS